MISSTSALNELLNIQLNFIHFLKRNYVWMSTESHNNVLTVIYRVIFENYRQEWSLVLSNKVLCYWSQGFLVADNDPARSYKGYLEVFKIPKVTIETFINELDKKKENSNDCKKCEAKQCITSLQICGKPIRK